MQDEGLQKREQACRFCSSTGFVNFKKTKPLNLNMQAAPGKPVRNLSCHDM